MEQITGSEANKGKNWLISRNATLRFSNIAQNRVFAFVLRYQLLPYSNSKRSECTYVFVLSIYVFVKL